MTAQTLELLDVEENLPALEDIDADLDDLDDEGYEDDELEGLSSDLDNWATDEDDYYGNSDRDVLWSLMR